MKILQLETDRLLLRGWRDTDREPFAELNADPEVKRYFPSTQTRAESDAMVDRLTAEFADRGWGLWAVEVLATGEFAGFVGLSEVPEEMPFAPAIEVGWRLAKTHWGKGYAPEAGQAALDFAFDELGLAEVVSFTTVANQPSRRVMEKLGMNHDPADDFEHPRTPGWSGAPHVLYRLRTTAS